MVEISFSEDLELEGVEKTLWIEAKASVNPRGHAYSDEQGDFGPETFDVDIEMVSAWLDSGVEVFGTLSAEQQRHIRDRIEYRAINV